MEIQVRERLVGALVLVAIVVLFVPALLKGPERATAVAETGDRRSVVVPVPGASAPAQEDKPVPEPLPPEPEPASVEHPLPQAAAPPATTESMRAEADVPAVGIAPGQPAWAVQLGAFSTREKADVLVAQLRKRGYSAFVLEHRASGKLLHRVRVGPEQDRQRAAAIADRLRQDGFQPVVAPHP
jgi:DedD protein